MGIPGVVGLGELLLNNYTSLPLRSLGKLGNNLLVKYNGSHIDCHPRLQDAITKKPFNCTVFAISVEDITAGTPYKKV